MRNFLCVLMYLQTAHLPSDVRQTRRIVGHIREHQALLVIVFAQDFVVAQIETITHAKPGAKKRAFCRKLSERNVQCV